MVFLLDLFLSEKIAHHMTMRSPAYTRGDLKVSDSLKPYLTCQRPSSEAGGHHPHHHKGNRGRHAEHGVDVQRGDGGCYACLERI